jgi:hypothetical protein
MIRFSFILIALLINFVCIKSLYAADAERNCATGTGWCREGGKECRSDHHWKCGKRKGDWYGARRKVTSLEDARTQFTAYFADQSVTISDITEKPWRFEADVINQNGDIVDRVIIDKRSGRVRSIY